MKKKPTRLGSVLNTVKEKSENDRSMRKENTTISRRRNSESNMRERSMKREKRLKKLTLWKNSSIVPRLWLSKKLMKKLKDTVSLKNAKLMPLLI